MNARLNHSYNAFLTMMAMDAEADAQAGRDMPDASQPWELREGGDAWTQLPERATGPALGGPCRGRFDGSAKQPRP